MARVHLHVRLIVAGSCFERLAHRAFLGDDVDKGGGCFAVHRGELLLLSLCV